LNRAVAIAATLALVAAGVLFVAAWRTERALQVRLEQRIPFPTSRARPCPAAGTKRLVILVLGQSNAGNHGAEEQLSPPASSPTVLVSNGRDCVLSGDPLPGATGRHRSVWTALASSLRSQGYSRELVFMPLAVESTTISDWTRLSSPLRATLERLLADSVAAGNRPDLIVWQQGEADAQKGTTADAYAQGLAALASIVQGTGAPVIVALSTRCGHDGPSAAIRSAIVATASARPDIRIGPDTDALGGPMRNHDCHFSASGLTEAADLWARALVEQVP